MTDTYDTTNPAKPTIGKDPDATLDYSWDWSAWLLPLVDTLDSFEIVLSAGLTLVSSSMKTGVVTAFLAGGVVGETASATCRVVTTGGRVDDRSIYLKIKDR